MRTVWETPGSRPVPFNASPKADQISLDHAFRPWTTFSFKGWFARSSKKASFPASSYWRCFGIRSNRYPLLMVILPHYWPRCAWVLLANTVQNKIKSIRSAIVSLWSSRYPCHTTYRSHLLLGDSFWPKPGDAQLNRHSDQFRVRRQDGLFGPTVVRHRSIPA